MKPKWKRTFDGYEYRLGDKVLGTVERHGVPNNSHYSVWSAHVGDWQHAPISTARDAKATVLKRLSEAVP